MIGTWCRAYGQGRSTLGHFVTDEHKAACGFELKPWQKWLPYEPPASGVGERCYHCHNIYLAMKAGRRPWPGRQQSVGNLNYIDDLALKIYGLVGGGVTPDPVEMRLYRIYALLALVRGDETSAEDVHDGWSVWRAETRPDHPSLVPFDQLTPEVQALDDPYVRAIRQVAGGSAGTDE